jgi:ferredoxin
LVGYSEIEAALVENGLMVRGGFEVAGGDSVPAMPDGRRTRTVIMAGNAGTGMWEALSHARPSSPDPLDSWSRSILDRIAAAHGAAVAMPSDGPPYAPFQRWAMRAEPVHPSPLGILIHPRWGLWHGYRGALLFAEAFEVPKREVQASPCETCAERPCLSTCPVEAFTTAHYAVDACATFLEVSHGRVSRFTPTLDGKPGADSKID